MNHFNDLYCLYLNKVFKLFTIIVDEQFINICLVYKQCIVSNIYRLRFNIVIYKAENYFSIFKLCRQVQV